MPFPLARPLMPMLSRSEEVLPTGAGWRYEPKYDGFRALVFRDNARIEIDSRNGKSLTSYFADLAISLRAALPSRSVIDGEIVSCRQDGLDFEDLSARLGRSPDAGKAGITAFIAFDILAHEQRDLRIEPFAARRERLEKTLAENGRVVITPQTSDAQAAQSWLQGFRSNGIEGVVAKRAQQRYQAGRRAMIKVRRHRLVDCVVGGYVPGADGMPIALVLGLYDRCGILHHVGQSSVLSRERREEAAQLLRRHHGRKSFREGRMPGRSRWGEQRDITWIPVSPRLCCEVAAGPIDDWRFRHAASLVRWRLDRDPATCSYSQLA
jgi:ATP-dependent DNA ligase